jgi:hypothetical protein
MCVSVCVCVCVNLATEVTVAILSGGRHRCVINIPHNTSDGRLECPPTQGRPTLPLLGFLHHE